MARHPVRYGILVFFAAYFVVITYFQSVHHRRAIEVATPSAAPKKNAVAGASSNHDRHNMDNHNNVVAHSTGAEQWRSSSLPEGDMSLAQLQPGDGTARKSSSSGGGPQREQQQQHSGISLGIPSSRGTGEGWKAGRQRSSESSQALIADGNNAAALGYGNDMSNQRQQQPQLQQQVSSGGSSLVEDAVGGLRPLVAEQDADARSSSNNAGGDGEGEGLRPLAEFAGEEERLHGEGQQEQGSGEGGQGDGKGGNADVLGIDSVLTKVSLLFFGPSHALPCTPFAEQEL